MVRQEQKTLLRLIEADSLLENLLDKMTLLALEEDQASTTQMNASAQLCCRRACPASCNDVLQLSVETLAH